MNLWQSKTSGFIRCRKTTLRPLLCPIAVFVVLDAVRPNQCAVDWFTGRIEYESCQSSSGYQRNIVNDKITFCRHFDPGSFVVNKPIRRDLNRIFIAAQKLFWILENAISVGEAFLLRKHATLLTAMQSLNLRIGFGKHLDLCVLDRLPIGVCDFDRAFRKSIR